MKNREAKITCILMAFVILFGADANAACTSPVGNDSQTRYDFTLKKMYYCDDTNWIEMGGLSGSGGGNIESYSSPEVTTWSAGTTYTYAHGLSGIPDVVAIWLKNTVATNGFQVGDLIGPYSPEGFNDGAAVGYGVVSDASNIEITWASGAYPFIRIIAPNGSRINASSSNFNYIVKAYRF